MPAQSKAQQRFMGMVHTAQKGDMENPSPEVEKAADSMSDKDAKDFASTSHKGLPDKIKEMVLAELRSVRAIQTDYAKTLDAIQQNLEGYKQSKGTPQEKQYVQKLKALTAQKKKLSAELDAKVSGMYKDAELKVDEMNTTGGVEGYSTPFAFSGKDDEKTKGKRQADLTGYSVVNESFTKGVTYGGTNCKGGCFMGKQGLMKLIKISKDSPKGVFMFRDDNYSGLQPHFVKDGVIAKATTINPSYDLEKHKVRNLNIGKDVILSFKLFESTNESMNENRWLELKRDESTAQSKIGKGISNINKQLAEMERFLNWYGKIKNESGVDNKSYWKRTNSHIYSIKERLLKLDQKIRQISE